MEFLKIAGKNYYFDLDKISDFIKVDESDGVEDILNGMEITDDLVDNNQSDTMLIDVTKWEMTKVMVETILSENSIVDEQMGVTKFGEQLSIPFRISFNTLLINKLIKNYGE